MSSGASSETKVYVTRTGRKYHRVSCGYLHSSYEIKLSEAVKRYDACSRCCPPTLTISSNDSATSTESTRIGSLNSSPSNNTSRYGLFSTSNIFGNNSLTNNSLFSGISFHNSSSGEISNPFATNLVKQADGQQSKLEEKLIRLFEKKLEDQKIYYDNKLKEFELKYQEDVKILKNEICENNLLVKNLSEKIQILEDKLKEEKKGRLSKKKQKKTKSHHLEIIKVLDDKVDTVESQIKYMMTGFSNVEKLLKSVDEVLINVDTKLKKDSKSEIISNSKAFKADAHTAGNQTFQILEIPKKEISVRKKKIFNSAINSEERGFESRFNLTQKKINFEKFYESIEKDLSFTSEINRKEF